MKRQRYTYIFLLCLCLILPPVYAFSGTVNIANGTFTIIPIHGDPIKVTSMTVEPESIDLLFYTTKDGQKGFIERTNIKNVNELLGLVKSDGSAENSQKLMETGKEIDRLEQEIIKTKQQTEKELTEMQAEANRLELNQRKNSSGTIESTCRKEWGTDYRMVEYCIKNQVSAKNNLTRYSGPILQKCREEWGTDYRMVEYCTKNQTAAKQRLGY